MAIHHYHLKANGDWKGGASAPKAPPLNPPLLMAIAMYIIPFAFCTKSLVDYVHQ